MGLCSIHVSFHMFIPPHFHLRICYCGDGIKAHRRTVAKVWRQQCLQQNFAFTSMPELESANSCASSQTHWMKIQEALFCPNSSEYLISWQCVKQTEGQRFVLGFFLTEQLDPRKDRDFRQFQIVLL